MENVINKAEKNLEKVLRWLADYKEETKCKGVVLGISGGKDSTVVGMLAKKIWGDNVYGVIMPNGEQADYDDAVEVASTIGIQHAVVNIGTTMNTLLLNIENVLGVNPNGEPDWFENAPKISEKALTNIPPRIRMTVLYAIAQTLGYRVIGTGNASEIFIGWTTKWGDGAHDLNPIAHLTCTEVVEIGKLLAKEFELDEKFVSKPPSDGLTGKTDEDNFGFTYEELDKYIANDHSSLSEETILKIKRMHENSEHKRQMPLKCNPNRWW